MKELVRAVVTFIVRTVVRECTQNAEKSVCAQKVIIVVDLWGVDRGDLTPSCVYEVLSQSKSLTHSKSCREFRHCCKLFYFFGTKR